VACLLAGARRHAAAAVAADIAHLVAHLVLPVVAATHHATRRAVYLRGRLEQGSDALLLHLQLLWTISINSKGHHEDDQEEEEDPLLLHAASTLSRN